jgi:hypothetical protein
VDSTSFLPWAIRTLARIDDAGWLEDFQLEVAEATRGPKGDLDRFPHHRYQVGRFARLASAFLAAPIGACHEAACEVLLPSTRRGIVLQILEEYEARLDEAALKAHASDRLAKDRRRNRSA